jgi:hypothetical protein
MQAGITDRIQGYCGGIDILDLMFQTVDPPPLDAWVRYMLAIWFILLIPWPIALMGAGMSSEGGGNQTAALILALSVLSYPVLVFVAFVSRRINPRLVFLPALSFAVGFMAASLI